MGAIADESPHSADMKLLVILSLVGVSFAAALPQDLVAPELVSDTEEVVQAKAEFKALYDAAAEAAAADAVPEVVNPVGGPAAVADTEEVAAAKASFQAAYDAAAAAAEAAPDHDLDGAISTHTGYLSGVDERLSPYYTNTFPYGAYGIHAPAVFAGAHPLVAGAPVVAGTHPLVAGAPVVAGAHPLVAGAPLLKSTVLGGAPLVTGSPLAYNTLGLGYHGYGFPYGLHTPFVRVVAEE